MIGIDLSFGSIESFLIALVLLGTPILIGLLAKRKGYSFAAFTFFALFSRVLVLLVVVSLPDRAREFKQQPHLP